MNVWEFLSCLQMAIVCTLSDEEMPGRKKARRTVLKESQSRGDAKELYHDVLPRDPFPDDKPKSKTKAVEVRFFYCISLT